MSAFDLLGGEMERQERFVTNSEDDLNMTEHCMEDIDADFILSLCVVEKTTGKKIKKR